MATAGTVSRDGWLETMEPTLLELWTWGIDSDTSWKDIWVQKESTKRREEIFEFARPDLVKETPEGAPYVQLSIERVRTASVVHLDVTGSIRITRQMQRDKQYNDMEEMTWGLGEAMNNKFLEEACNHYTDAFDEITLQGTGGEFVFATHTCAKKTSQTWLNTRTTALSPDAWNTILIDMMSEKNENGRIAPSGNKGTIQLIHTPQNMLLAERLSRKGQYAPGNADFDILTWDIKPICIPQLMGSSKAWANGQYYARDPRKAKNYYFQREAPSYDNWRDRTNDDIVLTCRAAYSFLWVSGHGVHGRNPS